MPSGTEEVSDSIDVEGTYAWNFAMLVSERMRMASPTQTFINLKQLISESVAVVDRPQIAYVMELADALLAADSVPASYVVALAEKLAAAGIVETVYHGLMELMSSVLLQDALQRAAVGMVAEELTADDEATHLLRRIFEAQEQVWIADTHAMTLTIIVEESAGASAGDAIELTAHLLAELLESVQVQTLLKTPSDIAQGWVMNTEGANPLSEYENYDFASMTCFGGKFYGASDTGLYEMGGDTDAGVDIAAELTSLMLDFGTSRQKRIRSAYLGYTSTGQLILKVRSVSDGSLTEHWYKAVTVAADAPRTGYMPVGQGLKSRYWQFELVNVDGADFEVDILEMHPLFLGRRV